ncbi:MAG: NADH-quinone oxidoreductase subunit NuoK [candidate division Zixibacteria bacterium]|nr:NADH-quinone oxidoreductase subunit NuoK [candidate division Zixibacteria bacterium]MBU1470467.1 NADH-quinone oxidoreductase subunit NuoK [candidate division Zixibacteria bacterium]MBU2625916.1 NADH-quinone oxidoreductase subunit NuoK [candidate division Zixibacteria bacterium]
MQVGLIHFLALGAVLFSIGIYGALTRRNAIGVLMSIELMFNAVNINFVAFAKFVSPVAITGQVFTVFVIAIAAAEATVGLAIVLVIYRNFKEIFVDRINLMKW